MTTNAYVIDTSYLLVLFKVPNMYSPKALKEIKWRFEKAINSNSRLFVPCPCICELGNHIAQIGSGDVRREIALQLWKTVDSSILSL